MLRGVRGDLDRLTRVATAAAASRALAGHADVDLVLLDLRLPDSQGLGTVRRDTSKPLPTCRSSCSPEPMTRKSVWTASRLARRTICRRARCARCCWGGRSSTPSRARADNRAAPARAGGARDQRARAPADRPRPPRRPRPAAHRHRDHGAIAGRRSSRRARLARGRRCPRLQHYRAGRDRAERGARARPRPADRVRRGAVDGARGAGPRRGAEIPDPLPVPVTGRGTRGRRRGMPPRICTGSRRRR